MNRTGLPALALLLLCAAACDRFGPASALGYQGGSVDAARERGRQLYAQHCTGCHGIATIGGARLPVRGMAPVPLDGPQLRGRAGALRALDRIRSGVLGTTMPAWGQLLSEQEQRDLALWVALEAG